MKKKIYLLLSVLLLSSMTFAANVTLWTEPFTTDLNGWIVYNTGGNVFAWSDAAGYQVPGGDGDATKIIVNRHATETNNAWLVSPGQTLTAGVTYTVKFSKRTTFADASSLEVRIGKNRNNLSADAVLWTNPASGTTLEQASFDFTPTTTDTYYIGFHCATLPGTDTNYTLVDKVILEEKEVINPPVTPDCDAITTFPFTQNFESDLTECWTAISNNTQNNSDAGNGFKRWSGSLGSGTPHGGTWVWRFSSFSNVPAAEGAERFYQYLITPKLDVTTTDKTVRFFYKKHSSGSEVFRVGYSTTDAAVGSFTWSSNVTNATSPGWQEYSDVVPANAKYIAINCTSYYQYYLYIDDLVIDKLADYDAGITAITAPPLTGINLTNSETVTVKIKNFGAQAISNFPVKFEVNGTVVENATYTGSIPSQGEVEYTFTAKANLSASGAYTITAYTVLTNDADNTNNSYSIDVTNTICDVITAPWSEGFDDTFPPSACWSNTATYNGAASTDSYHFWTQETTSQYPWGVTPRSGKMLQKTYHNNSKGLLITPTISTTGEQKAFSFYLYRCDDYPTYADLVNVYISTSQSIDGLSPELTINRNITRDPEESEAGWYQYFVLLPVNQGEVYIAIEGVGSNGGNIYLDDFTVGPPPPPFSDARVTAITAPTAGNHTDLTASETLTIKVKNAGTATLPTIPVRYSINGGTAVEEVLVGPYAPRAEVTYSFAAPLDLSAEGTYVIKAYTKVAGDAETKNDTTSITINNYICDVISSFPFTQDFESLEPDGVISPCWSYNTNGARGNNTVTGKWAWRFGYANDYLITPELAATATAKTVSYKLLVSNIDGNVEVGYSATDNAIESFTFQSAVSLETADVVEPKTTTVPADTKYIVFRSKTDGTAIYVDDIVIDFALDVVSTNIDTEAQIVDQTFEITFSKPITSTDLSGIKLTLADGTEATIEASFEGDVLTILHELLAYETTYTLTIPAGTITGYDQELIYTFTTEPEAPKVVSKTPEADAADVALDATVSITFDKAVDANGAPDFTGISILGLEDFNSEDGYTIAVEGVTFDGNTITIAHENFPAYKKIKVIIPANAVAGYNQEISWKFITVPQVIGVVKTDPENNETGVARNLLLSIEFDKSPRFNAAPTFTKISIIDDKGNEVPDVAATQKNLGGRPPQFADIITIDHPAFEYETTYTVIFAEGAVIGLGEYSWSFTTEAAPVIDPLTVVSKTPEADAPNVAVNAPVSITLDKAVNINGEPDFTKISVFETDDPGAFADNVVPAIDAENPNKLNISHADFAYSTTYTVTVPTTSIVGLSDDIVWSFTTGADPSIYTGTPHTENGEPWPVAGTIEAEDFDNGGNGVGYYDADAGHQQGNTIQYRPEEDVEIEDCSAGGYNIGFTKAGEWLNYTIEVAETGTYAIATYAASGGNNGSYHLLIDDEQITDDIAVDTDGWQTWKRFISTVELTAGVHKFTWYTNGDMNVDKFVFALNPKADLVITDITYTPAEPKEGDEVVFSAKVKNIGDATTQPDPAVDGGTNWKHGVAFSVAGSVVNWSDNFNTTGNTIAPDEEVTLTAVGGPSGKAFWVAKAGAFALKAEVNDTKNILESDYTNNTKTVDITVLSVGIQDIATGKVYAADGRLFVSAYPAGSSVTIYNVTGQSVSTHRVASDNLIVDLNPGAYIVNVQSQGKTNVYKVLVK